MKLTGTKAEVWSGAARKTAGGLTKADLMRNQAGKVVSQHQHANGKKLAARTKRPEGQGPLRRPTGQHSALLMSQ